MLLIYSFTYLYSWTPSDPLSVDISLVFFTNLATSKMLLTIIDLLVSLLIIGQSFYRSTNRFISRPYSSNDQAIGIIVVVCLSVRL